MLVWWPVEAYHGPRRIRDAALFEDHLIINVSHKLSSSPYPLHSSNFGGNRSNPRRQFHSTAAVNTTNPTLSLTSLPEDGNASYMDPFQEDPQLPRQSHLFTTRPFLSPFLKATPLSQTFAPVVLYLRRLLCIIISNQNDRCQGLSRNQCENGIKI